VVFLKSYQASTQRGEAEMISYWRVWSIDSSGVLYWLGSRLQLFRLYRA
jgi:hypothetical protein